MFVSRLWARLQSSPIVRLVGFALSACVFAFALRLAWLAYSYPLEIELREGSVWMHALAKRAGINIYDTTRVAFVNMNHGPLDPILKGWIAEVAPALPGHMVARTFVLLSPIAFFASALIITRGFLSAALLAGGSLFLLLCHISTMMFVGRSDATALTALAIAGALAHRALTTRREGWSRPRLALHLGLGAAVAAVFLTSWRYTPVPLSLLIAVLGGQLGGSSKARPAGRSPVERLAWLGGALKPAALSALLQLAGFAIVWLLVFVLELHADFRAYYRHFFGFFLASNSGWGTSIGPAFHLFPRELVETRQASMAMLFLLAGGGLFRLRREPGRVALWLCLLAATWVAIDYGYFKNQGGGGPHYFFPFITLLWLLVLHAFCRGPRWGAATQVVLAATVVAALPYRDLLDREKMLVDMRQQAQAFKQEAAHITYGQRVFGEETHLFKLTYDGEKVDTGDTDAAIAQSGYFGAAFTQTYDAYVRDLTANPPKFVVGGLLPEAVPERVMSPPLQDLLKRRYKLRLVARGSSFVNGGSQGLYERND